MSQDQDQDQVAGTDGIETRIPVSYETMHLTKYEFEVCVGAFFEMSTADAKTILPKPIQPLEAHHGRSILAVLAFRFTDSEVGPYDEIVLSVVTPPILEPGKPLPKAAFFPFMLGTSTEAARNHAIERWKLPHYMKDVQLTFDETGDRMVVSVRDDGVPVLDLTVTKHEFGKAMNPYHCFTTDGENRFKVDIQMGGPHSQHEEEGGELVLHDHPMTAALTRSEVYSYPFREEWYGPGLQIFEELERL